MLFPAELEMAQYASPSVADVLAGQQAIFETRRQVFQSQAAVNREKRSQVEKEIEGLRAQESAASRRIEIVREEAATVAMLVNKGLERRPRLLNLEREMADIEGRRGEIVAQISRAGQVINESQATLLKLENDRQNEIAQSLREVQNQIFQIRERLRAADDQLSRTAVKAPQDGVVTDLRIRTPGGVIGAGAPLMDLVPRQDPGRFDAPVIAEVTIISREANVTFSNGAILAVLNARVDKVIKGTLEGSALKVVTYLDSCTTIGFGHGFIAGAMRHDPQRGFELLAIHQPQLHTRPRP